MVDRAFADDAIANTPPLARHVGEVREANGVALGHLFAGKVFVHAGHLRSVPSNADQGGKYLDGVSTTPII